MPENKRQKIIETVYEEYKDKIEVLLSEITAMLAQYGYDAPEPDMMMDEEYRWYVGVPADEDGEYIAIIELFIGEEAVREGGSSPGVNFGMSIVGQSAVVLGTWIPHNYTDKCWVDARDREAVAERWEEFSTVDQSGIVEVLDR